MNIFTFLLTRDSFLNHQFNIIINQKKKNRDYHESSQQIFAYSKSTKQTPGKGVKYVQS